MSCSNVTLNWQKVTMAPEQSIPYDRAYEEQDEQDTDIGEHKSVIMSLLGGYCYHGQIFLPQFLSPPPILLQTLLCNDVHFTVHYNHNEYIHRLYEGISW